MTYGLLPENDKKDDLNQENLTTENFQNNRYENIVWQEISKENFVGEGGAWFNKVAFYKIQNETDKILDPVTSALSGGEWCVILAGLESRIDLDKDDYNICANIIDSKANLMTGINNSFLHRNIPSIKSGNKVVVEYKIKMPLLKNGDYSISISIAEGSYSNHIQQHIKHEAVIFKIIGDEMSQKHHFFSTNNVDIKCNLI